jgi:flagellar basal-body rod modification protein FlgD
MTVSSLSSTTGTTGAASAAASTTSMADTEQNFLQLLVTQLNNQDPLNPMDNAQLTSQLAQMSTVSGIQQLNTSLQSLLSQSSSGQVLQAASLVGRNVLVPGSTLTLQDGGSAAFAVQPSATTDAVGVDILDRSGNVVRHMDLGGLSTDVHQVSWDGLDDQGQAVAAGNYTVRVTAAQAGTQVAATALVFQQVQSVAQGSAGITLDTGSGAATAISDVRQIQ